MPSILWTCEYHLQSLLLVFQQGKSQVAAAYQEAFPVDSVGCLKKICAWNPSRIISLRAEKLQKPFDSGTENPTGSEALVRLRTFPWTSPPGRAWDLQLPTDFPTDLTVGSQQEFTSPNDHDIRLMIAARAAWIAITKQSSCALSLH